MLDLRRISGRWANFVPRSSAKSWGRQRQTRPGPESLGLPKPGTSTAPEIRDANAAAPVLHTGTGDYAVTYSNSHRGREEVARREAPTLSPEVLTRAAARRPPHPVPPPETPSSIGRT